MKLGNYVWHDLLPLSFKNYFKKRAFLVTDGNAFNPKNI